LERAYVAGHIDGETLTARLNECGVTDTVEQVFLLAALDVLKEWGVTAPNMSERVTAAKVEPATEAQWARIRRDCKERNLDAPDAELTKAQASNVIEAIAAGTYDAKTFSVPF